MHTLNARCAIALVALAGTAACGGEAGPAGVDGEAIRLPPGATLIEGPLTGAVDRSDLGSDRQIEYRVPDGTMAWGLPSYRIWAMPDGTLVVLSSEGRSLSVFDGEGELIRNWGRAGTGAGELFGPVGLAVVGDEVVVADAAAMRLLRWRLDGEYITEVSDDSLGLLDGVIGTVAGGLVVKTVLRTRYDDLVSIALFSLEGRELRRFTQMPTDRNVIGPTVWPRPDAAIGPDGRIYASAAADYEVQAIEADGTFAWVLRVPWPRLPLGEEARRTIERTQRAGRALGANVAAGSGDPAALPALAGIEVDGSGRLYVFPFVEEITPHERYPVDVYDAAGVGLAAGWLPFQGWDTQAGDMVYRLETAPDGASVIVRYRLPGEFPPREQQ